MTLKQLRDQNLIIFEAICGSKAYGTAEENSDTDIIGVYVLPQAKMLGGSVDTTFDLAGNEFPVKSSCIRVKDDVSKTDAQYFELRHYLKLLAQGSPQAIESLFLPGDCIISCDSNFRQLILDKRYAFMTDKLRYSFLYSPLRLLKQHVTLRALTDKTYFDFYHLLPTEIKPSQNWLSYISTFSREIILPTDYIVEKIEHCKDVYALYVSHRHQAMRVHEQVQDLPTYPGIQVNEEGYPYIYKREKDSPMEISYPLSFVRNIYFDREGYLKYLAIRKQQIKIGVLPGCDRQFAYDGKALAHCYRLLRYAVNIACTHQIKIELDSPLVYHEIRTNRTPFTVLHTIFEGLQSNALKAFEKETSTYDAVSLETLGELEVTLRSRYELTRAMKKEHILNSVS